MQPTDLRAHLDELFAYKRPNEQALVAGEQIYRAAKTFAETIVNTIPAGPLQTQMVSSIYQTAGVAVSSAGKNWPT